jgi:hypothetical protein
MNRIAFRPRAGFWISLLLAAAGAAAIVLLPWEIVGAPVLSAMFFGGLAAGLILWDSPAEERRFVIRLFVVALVVRLLAALLIRWATGGGDSHTPSDAVSYDRAAWVLARNWQSPATPPEGLGPLFFIADDFYPRLLAGLYFVLGHSPVAAVVLNTVLGASSVYIVYRLGTILFGPVTARWAGWLAAFYTGFWWWEMLLLKDTLFLFLILLFFLSLHRLWNRLALPDRSAADWLRAAVWGALLLLIFSLAGEIREYVPVLLLAAAALLPVAVFLRSGRSWRWVLVAGAAAVVAVIFWRQILTRELVPVSVDPQSMLFQITELPVTKNVGTFLRWVLGHPPAFLQYMALASFTSALAPYAWILPGTVPEVTQFEPGMIAFPGMWMWYALIPFSVFGAVQAVRRSKGEAWPVVFFAAAAFLLFAFFIPRESRHRDIVMPFALLLAAEGLVFSRRWWLLGLMVWIPLTGFVAWKWHSLVPILLAAGLAAAGILVWRIRVIRRRKPLLVKER